MIAAKLHELRTEARRFVEEGRFDDAIRRYVEAADLADQHRISVEAEALRSRARQVIVYVWARAHGHDIRFDDVRAVHVPARGLVVGPVRRFVLGLPSGELAVRIDPADRVRIAPRRRT